jgi:hypothetical protein
MHESETSIKNDVTERKLLHGLTQPREGILKSQGASDSLIKSLRDSNLVASKEEAAAVESAAARESSAPSAEIHPAGHHRHVLVFDVAFGHLINLSQWGGLDYEIAFYSYRFAGEDQIQPALIDNVGTRTVVSRVVPEGAKVRLKRSPRTGFLQTVCGTGDSRPTMASTTTSAATFATRVLLLSRITIPDCSELTIRFASGRD